MDRKTGKKDGRDHFSSFQGKVHVCGHKRVYYSAEFRVREKFASSGACVVTAVWLYGGKNMFLYVCKRERGRDKNVFDAAAVNKREHCNIHLHYHDDKHFYFAMSQLCRAFLD